MSAFVLKENKAIDEKYYYAKHKSGLPIYVIPKNHTTSNPHSCKISNWQPCTGLPFLIR